MRGLLLGMGLGALVAAQVGPMSLFLIRSTLRSGARVGLAIGAGIATVDAAYAALGVAGAAPLLSIDALRVGFGLVGAVVLAWLGMRTIWSATRVRAGLETPGDVVAPRRAFLTALGATASNPATIASWAAVFAATSTAADTSPAPLVAGVGLGSLLWVTALAAAVAVVRRAAGRRTLLTVDVASGAGLLAFAAALGRRTLRAA